MQIESDAYRLELSDDGIFEVYWKQPPRLRVREYVGGQWAEKAPEPDLVELARHLNCKPYFSGAYAGSGKYLIDLDCGFQRWNGLQSAKATAKALRTCGFNAAAIMRKARKHTHSSISYSW